MKKKFLYPLGVVGILSTLFFFLLPLTVVDAQSVVEPEVIPEHKIEICHEDSNYKKPYGPKAIIVDKNSTAGGHDGHVGPVFDGIVSDWGDIIPPYTYFEDGIEYQYLGKNWNTIGQAILSHDCQIVEELTVEKTSDSKCVEGGMEIIYTIKAINTGSIKVPVYEVVDILDSKVLSCSQVTNIVKGGVCKDNIITWDWDDVYLGVGKSGTVSYTLNITDGNYGTYTNSVEVVYGDKNIARTSLSEMLYCQDNQKYCEETIDGETVWSDWFINPQDDTQEMKTGVVALWDAEDNEYSCGTREVTEYRDVEIEMCTITTTEYGEWSDWEVDPNDDTQEMRTRTVYLWDAEDETYACGENTDTEYRPIEDEGDVLGESDEKGEVLGTSIVPADTAGGDSLIISLVEFILVILSAVSINYTLKKKLQLK